MRSHRGERSLSLVVGSLGDARIGGFPADRVRRYASTCFPASEDELLSERRCVR